MYSQNDTLAKTISDAMGCNVKEIKNIKSLKKGMTNHSFVFECEKTKYIIRVPGEGTDKLINREGEAQAYKVIEGHEICEEPVYINAENGIKITKFINNVRPCDPKNKEDVTKCMKKLKKFHNLHLKVDSDFDLFERIEFYEKLRGRKSVYEDYEKIKNQVFSLRSFIEKNTQQKCLTHIDAVFDNFLFDDGRQDELSLQLTDWEYAAMQDPHLDIAMFCIYAFYNKDETDWLIDIYFDNKCSDNIRTKIYCYMAAGGLMWSNWCEYKSSFGIEFGKYPAAQYGYAKDFFEYAADRIEKGKI